MRTIQTLPVIFLFLALSFSGFCTIIHVPADYGTIQEGINAASNGDIVIIEPGTYYENLNMNGKGIILCSNYFTTGNPAFIAGTIIDGSNAGRVMTINQWEDSSCQVIGLTLQNGNSSIEYDDTYGGGMYISDASPQIRNCIIQNNYAPGYGGGIAVYGFFCSAKVMNCTIQNNAADSVGGGVFIGDCSSDAEIANCIIRGNTITDGCPFSGSGGGVHLSHTGRLENCLITGNSAPNAQVGGGGVFCDQGEYYGSQGIFITGCTIANNHSFNSGGEGYAITGGEFRNCILWGNTDYFGNIYNYDGSSYVNCCTTPLPGGSGNIDSDPVFINASTGNFRLSNGSPCIDAGDSFYSTQLVDLDGNQRVVNDYIDMGSYETGAVVSVQIGTGSDYTGQFPINSCYNYNYSQQIYLGGEITTGGGVSGFITKIRFPYNGGASQFSNWSNWTVYLGNTLKTVFDNDSDWVASSAMLQVFSGTIPEPVPGEWVEISLAHPFYYSGSNLVVAVDENSPGYDCTAQWGSFYTGTPRGLGYCDDSTNPDPAFPPVANTGPEYSINQVRFEINPFAGILQGHVNEEPNCNIPIEGATIIAGPYTTISDTAGYYQLALPAGSYSGVTAIYHNANQTTSALEITTGNTETRDFCLQPYYAPPVGLQAQVQGPGLNNVHLIWQAPGSVPDQWIHWDNGTITGGLGYEAPFVFSIASRWPVSDIAPYGGTYLRKIRYVVSEATNATYKLKVWKGSNASIPLLTQDIVNPLVNNWNEVTLSPPLLVDPDQELWFGYEITQIQNCYPAALGPGPAVAGKGDMINSGGGWFSMKEAWGWEFNWPIQGFVSESPVVSAPQQMIPMVLNQTAEPTQYDPMHASRTPQVILTGPTQGIQPSVNLSDTIQFAASDEAIARSSTSSPLLGYNVYRNNILIAGNIPDLSYDDLTLAKGSYDYFVTAQYQYGESAIAGPVHVDIYTCFPPVGLMVSNATLTTTTADLSWTPSTMSPNTQWNLEWGPAGFTQGNGTTVIISGTPAYSLTGLTPGAEYDFYLSTSCNATDASAWVKKTFRTHYFNCPAGATPEAEVCGTNTNGCDLIPPAFETIGCGQTICGTSWLSHSHRDSDWYTFNLTVPTDVTLTGMAEFTNFMGIGSAPCPSPIFYTSWNYSAGYSSPVTTQLGAGTYFVYVASSWAEQVVCDSLSRYWVKLTCNTCLTPTALNAINITQTTADLVWASNATLWNIEYGQFGFIPGTGTMINGTDLNPYHLSGLTMGKTYSYYVQSVCGGSGTSNWAGPYSFYLPCPATILPYSEDFNSQLIGSTPQCWQVHGEGSPSNWMVELWALAGGFWPELVLNMFNIHGRSYLASPVLNTTGMSQLNLSFKQYISLYSSNPLCEVWTTSDRGVTWNPVWSYTQSGQTGPVTKDFVISTPDVGSGTFQFAFAVYNNVWGEGGTWHIDDIVLTGVPQTGTLQGTVTNCTDVGPIEGVVVTAGLFTDTTDVSGFYQFLDIPVGSYTVGYTKTGYVSKSVLGVIVQNTLVTTLDTCLMPAGPPVSDTIRNVTILSGQTTCFDATQTIVVAGSGTTFVVESGGSATMIAGLKIKYLSGTHVGHGGYMHGKIAPNGPYCGYKAISAGDVAATGDNLSVGGKPVLRVYPNPTNGKFRLELKGVSENETVRVEIYGIRGEKVSSAIFSGEPVHEFSMSDKPAGIYFIEAMTGGGILTSKLIKTK